MGRKTPDSPKTSNCIATLSRNVVAVVNQVNYSLIQRFLRPNLPESENFLGVGNLLLLNESGIAGYNLTDDSLIMWKYQDSGKPKDLSQEPVGKKYIVSLHITVLDVAHYISNSTPSTEEHCSRTAKIAPKGLIAKLEMANESLETCLRQHEITGDCLSPEPPYYEIRLID